MKIKQHLPSIFTIINLFLGFLAIINTMEGNYIIACYFILAASVFDSIDGKIARFIGISTNFGKEIDSFEVKRIYYDSSKGQCWISKERKKQFKTYFTTYGCRGR